MKKNVLLALATIFLMSISAVAQDPIQNSNPTEKQAGKEMKHGLKPVISPEKRADKMAKELGLTAEEKSKVLILFQKQETKMKENMGKVDAIRGKMKAKHEAEMKANDEELTKIIGPEKFQKLQALRAERMGKMKNKKDGLKPQNSSESATETK